MILHIVKILKVLKILIRIFSLLFYFVVFYFARWRRGEESAIELNDEVKPYRQLFACIHYRAHPRHYRAEYVRGYLHRKRCV